MRLDENDRRFTAGVEIRIFEKIRGPTLTTAAVSLRTIKDTNTYLQIKPNTKRHEIRTKVELWRILWHLVYSNSNQALSVTVVWLACAVSISISISIRIRIRLLFCGKPPS